MSHPALQFDSGASEGDPGASMSDEVFAGFQRIALDQTGIELASGKRAMIVNRFSRRLQALGLSCFEDYLNLVSDPYHPEAKEFIETVTTNLTYFFRESHHFKVLSDVVLPELARRTETSVPIRIWSSACSSGQEPYSLAITALETPIMQNRLVRILCTDIDSKMLTMARIGVYNLEQLRGLSTTRRDRWFKRNADGRYSADDSLRALMIFKRLNLFDYWPIRPGVDVIFCRNVMIYFNPSYQEKVIKKFASVQHSGAFLFMGHSETLEGYESLYKRVDNTVYERL